MKSYIVFPQTAWVNSSLGFHGIKELDYELNCKNVKSKCIREYQAIVFEIENLNEEIIELIRTKLPDDYEIPALIEGDCSIISKKGAVNCNVKDEKFKKLMKDAHLEVSSGNKIKEKPYPSLTEINELCNKFADNELIPISFKELDIEKLHKLIHINKKFEHKLIHILEEIKCIWFALDYDIVQLSKNIGESVNERFKRYMYINNAIVRIRAVWEKLIQLAILLEQPSDYDKILNARSVRSKFIKNFKDSQHPVVKDIWDYVHSLDTFEQRFRTPELHKIGRTIRWAAQEKLGPEVNRFIAYRNDLNRLLRNIIEELEKIEK